MISKLEQEVTEWEKKNTKTLSSLEIINKRCAGLDRDKVMLENKVTELQQTINELNNEVEKLTTANGDLQKEIETHQKVNQELIAMPSQNKPAESDALKEKKARN